MRSIVDGHRVLADLRALRAIGPHKTGVHKPSLSAEHVASLAWLEGRMREAGLAPVTDGIGNVLGRSSGQGRKLLAGSHLESQNYAGWLDGPLGVVYALEAARVMNADARVNGGVDVVSFCDEEGHFGHFLGSRSFIGGVSEADIDAAVDRTTGTTMRQALATAGYAGRPRLKVEAGRYSGYIEAHIEQGENLESANLKIGVVTSIVGIWQFKIVIDGAQNHAGTTRMAIRRDAGVAAVRLLTDLHDTFPRHIGPRTVWTVGRIALEPGAPSIIPGRAEILFQIRDDDIATLQRLETVLRETASKHADTGPCPIAVEKLRASVPAMMDPGFQTAIERAVGNICPGKSMRLPSGAGHDAQVLSTLMPAAMLFVPSIGGISHHWTENTSDADIITGAEVFVAACTDILGVGSVVA
jgi:beta-ureidopropionase / N-carbamoyl-L-amino-acid hydrolase